MDLKMSKCISICPHSSYNMYTIFTLERIEYHYYITPTFYNTFHTRETRSNKFQIQKKFSTPFVIPSLITNHCSLTFSPSHHSPRRSQIKIKGHGSRVSPPIHIHETERSRVLSQFEHGLVRATNQFSPHGYIGKVYREACTHSSLLSGLGYPLRSASKQEEYSKRFEAHACVLFVSDDVAIISLPP